MNVGVQIFIAFLEWKLLCANNKSLIVCDFAHWRRVQLRYIEYVHNALSLNRGTEMEIEISGRPQFGFKPTLTLLQALETCAILHYDGACKATAAPGGLIHREIQSLGFVGPDAAYTSWSFRELDLILKVCENPPRILEANSMAVITEFIFCAQKALMKANEVVLDWKIHVDCDDPDEGVQNGFV